VGKIAVSMQSFNQKMEECRMSFFKRLNRLLLLAAVLLALVCVLDIAAQGKSGAATFTDKRAGRVYKTVKMPDGKTWMAENLNHKTGNSWCYEDNDANCKKYGRLYDWNTAKAACPAGWHLPSRAEWRELVRAVDPNAQLIDNFDDANVAGTKLKAAYGWENNGNGTDEYGFSALPGGDRYTDGSFDDAGVNGNWWAATENGSSNAYYRDVNYGNGNVYEDNNYKSLGFSVRCVGD
jgi:uncharacterized protein (TIGR02145 family)